MNDIKNDLHNKIQFLYSLRNFITDTPVWLSYTNKDLINKSQKYIEFIKPKGCCKVIDLGCGNGIMLQPYLKITKPENIYGVDMMITNIIQSRKNLPDVPTNNFSVNDIINYNFVGKYDIIIMHGVIGLVEPNKQQFILNKLCKMLHKNGTLILGAINFVSDAYIFQTYPFANLKYIRKLCKKYNMNYSLYPDSDFDNTGKYNAHTLIIRKLN